MTKETLRLSPPHRERSPEVPFCISGKGEAKSHGCPWLERSIPAILYKTLRDFVRLVRNNYVREHFYSSAILNALFIKLISRDGIDSFLASSGQRLITDKTS